MSFALVLSGGGPVGVAWEAGLLKGLRDAGVDLTAADLVLGTSAGAIVGANVVLGALDELYTRQLLPPPSGAPHRDVAALMRAYAAAQGRNATPRLGLDAVALVKLGEMALRAPTEPEQSRLMTVRSYLPANADWPVRDLHVTAVDVATGELVIWKKGAGATLLEAVASSCAAPMLAPPITIGGRRYMDAGPLSGTSAQLAAGHDFAVVLAVARPGAPLGPLQAEIDALRTGGSRVEVVVPDAASAAQLFPNLLDLANRKGAAEAGMAQAAALAATARSWRS